MDDYRMNEGRNSSYKFNIYDRNTNEVLLSGLASGGNKTDAEKSMKNQAMLAGLNPYSNVNIKFQMIRLSDEEMKANKRNIKMVMAQYGYNQKRLSERFSIPYRTIQNWVGGQRECPDYIIGMMDEILAKEER